ncbi:hypothetical protein [Lactococcus fujiensis]|uniref:hypothetical protein n=1 Tax=Lactococcus fujiensis TaxID=610251 RepID=UPI0006D04A5B|nr:hypothetical protein [Lactococcus fujiensis]
MTVIDFSKKKIEEKRNGRFKVKIKTIEATNSLFVSYDIAIRDFEGDDELVCVYSEHYTGSDPVKRAKEMINQIKDKKSY